MTIDTVKEKIHEYVEHANQNKIMAIYTFISDELEQKMVVYDEATLNMLETRKQNMLNGKDKSLNLAETIENMRELGNGRVRL